MIVIGISVISELIMTLAILYCIPLLGNISHRIRLVELIISAICFVLFSICFNLLFYLQNAVLELILLIANHFKFIAVAIILYRKCSIKIICMILIIHSICGICQAGISFVIPMEQTYITYASEVSLLAVRVAFLLLIIVLKYQCKRNYLNNIFKILPNYIYIMTLINLFLANGLLETANYKANDIFVKETTVKILALSLTLCVIATLISLLFSVVSKKYFNDINSLLEKQIHTQIGFYEEREKTYAEIRRFKHDYTNHINCIRSMLNAEKYTEVAEYLENITGMFPSEGLLFNTGNFISDAILSDKQNSIAGENITINFEGTIPTAINETDLCIILGNAIDNAIEASRELDGEKTILVYGGFSHSYFILTVTNPTVNTSNNRDILPFTSKADKSEHGFGLLNIKSVVDKYNGRMKIENEDNLFTLSLTFNSIISEVVKS